MSLFGGTVKMVGVSWDQNFFSANAAGRAPAAAEFGSTKETQTRIMSKNHREKMG